MPPLTSWLSDRLPAVVGWLRPVILWPDTAMTASLLVAVLVTAAMPPREARADELPKDINKIESLTPEQARKLVETFPGVDVTLKRSKDNETETAFDCLPLNGLKKLNADVALVLASYRKGPLFLNGLTTLDAATAKTLVSMGNRWNGSLPALAAFESPDSVAVAHALATREGGISLPNLKKISPKTLTALIEIHQTVDQTVDVRIPPIEALELIQEPDGSATDDFEIPAWLEVHEQRKREMAEQVRRMKLEDQQRAARRQRARQKE